MADNKEIELRLAIADGLEEIYCDRASLEVALANLLDNALKYTPSGGVVELAATEEEDRTELSVADSGPGIQPDDDERIFDRFLPRRKQQFAARGRIGAGDRQERGRSARRQCASGKRGGREDHC